MRRYIIIALAVLMFLGTIGVTAPQILPQAHATGSAANPLYFKHVVWLVMENHKLSQLNTGTAATNGSLAYTLNTMNSSAAAYNSGYESTSGSLPNYLAMISAATQTTCDQGPASCGTFAATNIVDGLETAGLTWKGYMEGWSNSSNTNMCSGAMRGDGGTNYIAHHNPFVYFNDIFTSGTRCTKVVAAGSYAGITGCGGTVTSAVAGNLVSDLSNRTTSPNFMYLVPNNYDNTHDCSNYAAVGNNYLKTLVPLILQSDTFVASPSVLVITYDEGTDVSTTEPLYTVWIGNQAQSQFKDSVAYNHYSILRTIEDNWGIPTMTGNDGGTTSMASYLYSVSTSNVVFDRLGVSWNPTCGGSPSTLAMPASTVTNVTALIIWTSLSQFGFSNIASPSGMTDSANINIGRGNQGVASQFYPEFGVSNKFFTLEELGFFSTAKVPATTYTFSGSMLQSTCTLTVIYIGNTVPDSGNNGENPGGNGVGGFGFCSLNSPTIFTKCVLSNNSTSSHPTVSNYQGGQYQNGTNWSQSLQIAIVGGSSGANFYAAEQGFSCLACSGSFNGTSTAGIFTGLEYRIANKNASPVALSYDNYNGKGLSLSSDWGILTDDILLSPLPPVPASSPSGGCLGSSCPGSGGGGGGGGGGCAYGTLGCGPIVACTPGQAGCTGPIVPAPSSSPQFQLPTDPFVWLSVADFFVIIPPYAIWKINQKKKQGNIWDQLERF